MCSVHIARTFLTKATKICHSLHYCCNVEVHFCRPTTTKANDTMAVSSVIFLAALFPCPPFPHDTRAPRAPDRNPSVLQRTLIMASRWSRRIARSAVIQNYGRFKMPPPGHPTPLPKPLQSPLAASSYGSSSSIATLRCTAWLGLLRFRLCTCIIEVLLLL